jgi:hypothetical protein
VRRLGLGTLFVACLVLLGSGAAESRPAAGLPRSTVDRPDEVSGPQVHAFYVVPSDLEDRALDTSGVIAASVSNWEVWLQAQTGGRDLRLDLFQGQPDVTFFRMPQTDAQIAATGAFVRDAVERALIAAGLTQPNKIYAVYYDGTSLYACGGGAWPPVLPGIVGALYLRAQSFGVPCYEPQRSSGGQQIMDFAMLHELLHTLGFVPTCAPHQTRGGHASDSSHDLMYAGDDVWRPDTLDVGRDDYFEAHVPGCLDLASSPFLETAPATPPVQPQVPPAPTAQPKPHPKPRPKPVPKCKRGQKPTKKKPCRRR